MCILNKSYFFLCNTCYFIDMYDFFTLCLPFPIDFLLQILSYFILHFQDCIDTMAEATISSGHCFVCDKDLSASRDHNVVLLSNLTQYSRTGLPTKIGQLMGDGFMVVVTACDEACTRCYNLLNLLDKLEIDLDKVRRLLTSYLRKKYGLIESM